MDNEGKTDWEQNQVQQMPVLLSYPGWCESGCPFRCDDPDICRCDNQTKNFCRCEDPLSFTEIQFQLPNGEKHNHLFTAKTTIQEVKEYVRENLRLPFADFTLSVSSPQLVFKDEHFANSLGVLGLAPFAVLTVRPNIQIQRSTFTNAVEMLGSFILAIIFVIMIIVYRIYEIIVGFLCS